MPAVQRIRQGIRALLAFSQAADLDMAAEHLNPAQLALFRQLQHNEQLHSLNVLRDVLAQAEATPNDLAVAALLHDCGKSRYPLAVWQKTLTVLVRAFAPSLYTHWQNGDPSSPFARPVIVSEQHPAWSAALAAEVDTTERALWLIAHHADDPAHWQDHPHFNLLKRLKTADDAN